MRSLLKKPFVVLCILQLAQSIYGQETTVEPFKSNENSELLREEELEISSNLFPSSSVLPEKDVAIDVNLLEENVETDSTTISPEDVELKEQDTSSASCSDVCRKQKLCLCDSDEILKSDEPKLAEYTTLPTETETPESEKIEESLVEDTKTSNTPCQLIGDVKPKEDSCNSYSLCVPADEGLHWSEQECPPGTAFNSLLKRCARDLSKCVDDLPQCTRSGTFPDAAGNNTYIWCLPKKTELGWHKYRVRCAAYEVFLPTLGACFMDVQKISAGALFLHETRDLDVLKAELAEIKVLEKQLLKKEKLQIKMQKKQEKLMIKQAIKEAQARAKLEGADSSELKSFVCTQEGAFPSPLGVQFYNNCVSKKGKFKALTMMCAAELKFDEHSGVCV